MNSSTRRERFMETNRPDGELVSLVRQSRAALQAIRYLLEEHDLSSSTLLAKNLADRLEENWTGIEEQSGGRSLQKSLAARHSQLLEDKKLLDSAFTLKTHHSNDLSESQIRSIASLLDDYIELLERGPGRKAGWIGKWGERIVKGKRRLFRVFLGMALIVVIGVTSHHLYFQKHSLVGEYYDDMKFASLFARRLDRQINFNWGNEPPLWHFRNDFYSIRWTGYLDVPGTGAYEFATLADDGARLWIDDHLIIDDWVAHAAKLNTGVIQLTRGYHKIKLEYFQYNYAASISLFWKSEADPKRRIISPKYFISNEQYIRN